MDELYYEYYEQHQHKRGKKRATNVKSVYSEIKKQDNLLSLKRGWLLGLDESGSDNKLLNGDVIISTDHNNDIDKNLPESFLRQDDVFYETVNASVRKGFEAMTGGRDRHDITQTNFSTFDFPIHIKDIVSILDDMTNNGLQLFAQLFPGGSSKSVQTRGLMKIIIKEHLPQLLKNIKTKEETRAQQLCEILNNPQNFHSNIPKFSTPSYNELHAAAKEILEGLEDMDMDLLTLIAMHRKLKRIKDYMPQFNPKKSGWRRRVLAKQIRKMGMRMLSKLGDNDELQEPLAKAMAVATLSSNLIKGSPIPVEFRRFSSEIIMLQNEIGKAITLLKPGTFRFEELENVQIFLDPNNSLSNNSFRRAVTNLLEEFLFECSDLDTIPVYLLEMLSFINKTSRSDPYRSFPEEEIEVDLENVLGVSARMRQILLDFLPEYDYGHDFAYAYMEPLEDDDDSSDEAQGLFSEKSRTFRSNEGYDHKEAIGETSPVHNDVSSGLEPGHFTGKNLRDSAPNSSSLLIDSLDNIEEDQESTVNKNQYLNVQEAGDITSLVAYQLIGRLLEKFAETEGLEIYSGPASYLRGENLSCNVAPAAKEEHISKGEADHGSVIVQVLEELLPSFSESGKEKVKDLMGLK